MRIRVRYNHTPMVRKIVPYAYGIEQLHFAKLIFRQLQFIKELKKCYIKGKSTKYSFNTNYSTTKLQTQLITTAVWGKENQSPHTAKPSTVKSYGHCSSIKKLKVVVTNVYEPVWLTYHFWLWCVQRWYEGFEAQMVTKHQKFLQQVG